MYQNDNGTISLTQETCNQYHAIATVKAPSIFDGSEVSPMSAAMNQLVGLYAVCIACTFIATLLIGKVV